MNYSDYLEKYEDDRIRCGCCEDDLTEREHVVIDYDYFCLKCSGDIRELKLNRLVRPVKEKTALLIN
jgi:hypothetical protein